MAEPSLLAQFLRSRRERLSPADVGLRDSGRRRTPGLRREEVATLAGVSIDYLVRLEQGRDTNPSPSVLAALGQALRLDHEELRHLMGLAARSASPELEQFCPAPPVLHAEVSPTVQVLLDQLQPTPAFVIGPLGDVVASNAAYRTLAGPLGLLDLPNLGRHVFLHPDARTTYPRWDEAADGAVARLRSAHRQLEDEPALVALLAELAQVEPFATRWAAHPVAAKRSGAEVLVHPEAGELHLLVEVLGVGDDHQQLVAWLPADASTATALQRTLAAADPVGPVHLRVVGAD